MPVYDTRACSQARVKRAARAVSPTPRGTARTLRYNLHAPATATHPLRSHRHRHGSRTCVTPDTHTCHTAPAAQPAARPPHALAPHILTPTYEPAACQAFGHMARVMHTHTHTCRRATCPPAAGLGRCTATHRPHTGRPEGEGEMYLSDTCHTHAHVPCHATCHSGDGIWREGWETSPSNLTPP